MIKGKVFKIGGQSVLPGERKSVLLKVARSYDYSDMNIPVRVMRGEKPGPTLFVSAAIHGDELNGVEVIRRLLTQKELKKISGILIAVPIVNVFGFNNGSRYLPDRRDLNRCFPGSKQGSLASRLAYVFMKEIVKKSTHGIDLHTGAIHRSNLPQIRACLEDSRTKRLAERFGAPIVLDSSLRDGSLREAARRLNIPMLLFEGGEALKISERSVRIGLNGVLSVMAEIGMLPKSFKRRPFGIIARGSDWVRAPQSGFVRTYYKLGNKVKKGETLAVISDPFGDNAVKVKTECSGVVIGTSTLPLVNQGDALFHIARFDRGVVPHKEKDLFDLGLS